MRGFSLRAASLIVTVAMTMAVSRPAPSLAASQKDPGRTRPVALYMGADLLIARPVLLAMTAVGTALYIASLPFSLPGGNAGEAGRYMVVGPARATFTRCLGCTSLESGEAAAHPQAIQSHPREPSESGSPF